MTTTWWKDGTIQQQQLKLFETTKVTENSTKDTTTQTEQNTSTTVETKRQDWKVGVLAGVDTKTFLKVNEEGWQLNAPSLTYGAQVERKVVGPFWLGAWGTTNGTLGLSVSASF